VALLEELMRARGLPIDPPAAAAAGTEDDSR
jgi:hypothetical protein